jgi:hypothetical protein
MQCTVLCKKVLVQFKGISSEFEDVVNSVIYIYQLYIWTPCIFLICDLNDNISFWLFGTEHGSTSRGKM